MIRRPLHIRATPPMRADDQVGPGLRRRVAYILTGVGILGVVVATLLSFQLVDRNAQSAKDDARATQRLTTQELAEIREVIGDRRQASDVQLEARDDVLCVLIRVLARDASTTDRKDLTSAGRDLGCPDLPEPSPRSDTAATPRSSSTPPADSDSGGSSTTSGQAPTQPSTAPLEDPPAKSKPSTPPPQAPAPEPSPGLLSPVTDPVCDLLGLCL